MIYGDFDIDDSYVQTSILPRICSYSAKCGDCLVWNGALGRGGYPKLEIVDTSGQRVTARVHRLVVILFGGDIGQLEVDHKCRNRRCVNIAHLEPVVGLENLRRMRRRLFEDKHADQLRLALGE